MTTPGPTKSRQNTSFSLLLSGEIETAKFDSTDSIYCKYQYVYGPDWCQVSGIEEGISPTCRSSDKSRIIVLNTPLEATFTSTSPFKWPQIVLSCYGPDSFGNDVIRGYGATFLPSTPGKTVRKIPIFVPQASSLLQKIIGFFTGRYAEFIDPRIVAMSEGRNVTRVSTKGFITLNLTTLFKDTKKNGYDLVPQTTLRISEFPIPNFEQLKQQRPAKTELNDPPPTAEQKTTWEKGWTQPEDPNNSTSKIQTINEEESDNEESEKTSAVD